MQDFAGEATPVRDGGQQIRLRGQVEVRSRSWDRAFSAAIVSSTAQAIGHVALVVRNYDEAIAFFPRALGFRLIEDADLGGGKRWVPVGPADSKGTSLLLAQAATSEQTSRIGNQTAADVYLCFCTHRRFLARLSG